MECSDTANVHHDWAKKNNNESLFLSVEFKSYYKYARDFVRAYHIFIHMNNKLMISKTGQNIACTFYKIEGL